MEGILRFLRKIYLSDTFDILISTRMELNAQSKQAPTQELLFLNERPVIFKLIIEQKRNIQLMII